MPKASPLCVFLGQNAVVDTLAALVYDVNATAEVLRRGSMKRKKAKVTEVGERQPK